MTLPQLPGYCRIACAVIPLLAAAPVAAAGAPDPAAPAPAAPNPAAPDPAAPASAAPHAAAPGPAAADSAAVPLATQAVIIDYFSKQLVRPETAVWRFDYQLPYPGVGQIVCGTVTYENAGRQTSGKLAFYAVMHGATLGANGLQTQNTANDPTGSVVFAIHTLCTRK